jgi:hypothetical protein
MEGITMSAFWRIWLNLWAWSVIVFGIIIAGGAFEATSGPISALYDLLQGPGPITNDPALRFSLAVMGGVSIGWGVTGLLAIQAAIKLGDKGQPVWNAVTLGLIAWFISDSALSVATGYGLNVVPNILLLGGYLIPLIANKKLFNSAA